jgi:hypothetical protein|tara:strand:- start:2257 stop:2481 length:225 start_codon:yes stop_codon:yes gene_type:complete
MPILVTLKLWWGEDRSSPTYYDMYEADIEEMVMNYEWVEKGLLFTFVELETWKQWVWDQLCHEPEMISVDTIKY